MIATPSPFDRAGSGPDRFPAGLPLSARDAATPLGCRAVHQELSYFRRAAIAPELRTMRRFATEEIVIPEGRFEGQKLRIERQPYVGLLFDEIDSGRWHRFAFTGCVQSGKTLNASDVPVCYHLFERRETVVFGIPSMDMAGDKWRLELLPVIQRTAYRNLIPDHGLGSRGGQFESITFKNGATLKFISGGGGDEKRSGFTTRVLVITEADKLDETSESSREADKVTQLEARTLSHDWGQSLTYMECTTSIEEGRIWQEYQKGSASRIMCPCPGCNAWVHPTRDCLQGWQNAADEIEAQALATWVCPEPGCGRTWTAAERVQMNLAARLLHKGQTIDAEGNVGGDLPRTKTLGFRWDAFNNLFWSAGRIAVQEWRGPRSSDAENAERELRQFWWALPALPPGYDEHPMTQTGLLEHVAAKRPRGVAPAWTDVITVGVDLGKFLAHWTAVAWKMGGTCHVVDYGRFEIPSDQLGVETAIYNALLQFADTIKAGWPVENAGLLPAQQVWVDARYQGKAVYAFIAKQTGGVWRASLGYGAREEKFRTYRAPKKISANVRFVGDGYHIAWLDDVRQQVAETNADRWKSFLHGRLTTPPDAPGTMTIFAAMPTEHLSFIKHLTSEKETREFVVDKGFITKWKGKGPNHWLDATSLCGPAAHWCGVRVLGGPGPTHTPVARASTWFTGRQNR